MINTKDIRDRIETDFGNNSTEVFTMLEQAVLKIDYLNSDRIVRCILFLADKDFEKLKRNIESATNDPRDVILWAEYTNLGQWEKVKRVRDFSQTFSDAAKI